MKTRRASRRSARSLVLGIETSCDETAAAVVARAADGSGRILSNVVRAQWEQHRRYGGVVPEIAARAHVECLDEIIAQAMREAGVGFAELDAVAVTAGPGLIGGLLVGVIDGQGARAGARAAAGRGQSSGGARADRRADRGLAAALSAAAGLRRAHAAADRARRRPLPAARHHHRRCAGRGLRQDRQAAGPRLSRRTGGGAGGAHRAGPDRFALPRPMLGRPEPHFSFAGLKTAVRHQAQALVPLGDADVADLCADFEAAVAESVADRVRRAHASIADDAARRRDGAAPRGRRRRRRQHAAARPRSPRSRHDAGYTLHVPPAPLCTDNAAMVAWAGAERLARGWTDGLDVAGARPLAARSRRGPGAWRRRLGAKA